jgi:subtilisin-like proprotein convertase family protein
MCISIAQAGAALYDSGFANSGLVPDGNATGWADSRTVQGLSGQVSDVTVRLTFSGGYNGDLYAYLSHDGVLVPLLNRVGTGIGSSDSTAYHFGFSASGMDVLLGDSGAQNIHDAASPLLNTTYLPDGRVASPLGSAAGLATSDRVGFSRFDGINPNGQWTLFFADLSSGGPQTRVQAWDLQVTAVPEPVNMALGIFGGVFVIGAVWKRFRQKV